MTKTADRTVARTRPKRRIKATRVAHMSKRGGRSANTKRSAVQPTARLEARVPPELYEIMKRAAELRGVSLTSYIIDSVGEQARKDIERITIIRLALPDQIRLAEALINPPAPNERLKSAFARRDSLIAPR